MTMIACDPLADRSMYERNGGGTKVFSRPNYTALKLIEFPKFCIFCAVADSEDSDEEGGLGNVNRLIIRPGGHSGKAKKGI